MSVSYLDTLALVVASGTDGLSYSGITKAMRVHVRSMVSEGICAGFVGDDVVTLDTDGAVVCLTTHGEAYASMFTEAGLIAPDQAKPKRKRQPKATSTRTVPSAIESVTSPVLPKGTTARRVPGNQHGETLHTITEAPKSLIEPSVLEAMIADAVARALTNA